MTKTYFITASAYMHENLFQRTETAELMLTAVFRYRDAGEFLVHEFVIMPNHIHLLPSVRDDHAVGRAVQMIKGGFSHEMGQAGLKLKAVWQPSYYEHRVRDAAEYARMRNYIHQNPVQRRLARTPVEYKYSSSRDDRTMDAVPQRLKPSGLIA